MPIPFVDVSSPILESYFKGVQIRQHKEQIAAAQAMEQQRIDQQNAQFQEHQKLLQDQLKQVESHNKAQLDALISRHTAEAQEANARARMEAMKYAAQYGYPTEQATIPNDPNNPMTGGYQQKTVPVQSWKPYPEQYPEMTIKPGEVPEQSVQERLTKAAEEKNATAETIQELKNKVITDRQEQLAKHQQELFDYKKSHDAITDALRMQIAMMANERAKSGREYRINKDVVGIQQTFEKSKESQDFTNISKAFNLVKNPTNIIDPKAQGVKDFQLIYLFNKALDPNRVTDAEVRTTMQIAVPKIIGIMNGTQRLVENAPLLSNEGRKALVKAIYTQYGSAKSVYDTKREANFLKAKKLQPDLTKEDWDNLAPVEQDPLSDIPMPSKRTPVRLVPK